jgi:hypothetical protein
MRRFVRDVVSPSERDDILVQRPPLALRTLLVLTTQPFRLGFAPTSSLATLLTLLTARNWHIRQAERRNHLLWRSGQTMRFSRWPIVILPADRGMMTRSQFELFVIVEIARAVSRVHSASGIEAELALPDPRFMTLGRERSMPPIWTQRRPCWDSNGRRMVWTGVPDCDRLSPSLCALLDLQARGDVLDDNLYTAPGKIRWRRYRNDVAGWVGRRRGQCIAQIRGARHHPFCPFRHALSAGNQAPGRPVAAVAQGVMHRGHRAIKA